MAYKGYTTLASAMPIGTVCKNGSLVPSTPTGTPTYSIYDSDWSSALATGNLSASDTDSKTGLRTATYTPTAGNGFAAGEIYHIIYEYVISATNYTDMDTFQVV